MFIENAFFIILQYVLPNDYLGDFSLIIFNLNIGIQYIRWFLSSTGLMQLSTWKEFIIFQLPPLTSLIVKWTPAWAKKSPHGTRLACDTLIILKSKWMVANTVVSEELNMENCLLVLNIKRRHELLLWIFIYFCWAAFMYAFLNIIKGENKGRDYYCFMKVSRPAALKTKNRLCIVLKLKEL